MTRCLLLLVCLIYGSLEGSQGQIDPPTYDLLMTFVADAPRILIQNRTEFLNTFALAGLDQADVEALGAESTRYFLAQYGVDFTGIDPSFFTEGTAYAENGAVSFSTFIYKWPEERQLRLVSAINHTNSALFTNANIRDLGWEVNFLEDFQSSGNISMTLPASSAGSFGNFLVQVQMDTANGGFFPEAALDGSVLRVQFQSREANFPAITSPAGRTPFLVFDIALASRYYGNGVGQAIVDSSTGDVRNVLRFPDRPL